MMKLGFNSNKKDQHIITNEKNEFQYAQYPYARLKQIQRKFDVGEITVHGLRHTNCTLMLEAGASVKEVQDRLGHEDANMVLEVYNHVNKKRKTELGNTFARYIAEN